MNHTLVIGATGMVGTHLVHLLVAAGARVRVLTRDARKGQKFGAGVEVAVGDLTQPDTLGPAMEGVSKLFLLSPPVPDLASREENAVRAAARAGVSYLVKLSNFGAGSLGRPVWNWHGESERTVRASGIAWTFLRPTRFMPDTPFPWSWDREADLITESTGNRQVPLIDPRDIAAAAARVLTTDGHAGRVYELTAAEALTGPQIAERLSAAAGRRIRWADVSIESVAARLEKMGVPPPILVTRAI